MVEYKIVVRELTSFIYRDVRRIAEELAAEVDAELRAGWEVQGGIASVPAGANLFLMQAVVRQVRFL